MSIVDFCVGTYRDFVEVWKLYPNVLIWSGIAILLALII